MTKRKRIYISVSILYLPFMEAENLDGEQNGIAVENYRIQD